jgi:hypothetical protein
MLGLALAASASLAIPTGALAAPGGSTPASDAVQAHANRSHAALVQAARIARGSNDRQAQRIFMRSRSELGKARAGANAIVKRAVTPASRTHAAEALGIVASLESKNLPQLIGMVDDVNGAFQKAVAKAALVDTLARDRAVDVLQVLLAGVPAAALETLSDTVAALMTGHTDEVSAGVGVIGQLDIPNTVKSILSTALGAGMHGQAGSAGGLRDIIGGLPDTIQDTLTSAFDLVKTEQQKAFNLLNQTLAGVPLPASVRSIITGVMDTTRTLLNGLLSSLAPTQPVATTPPATNPAPAPPVTTPGVGGGSPAPVVTGPTDLLTSILGAGSMPINLLNSILGSIPNPLTLINGILGALPNPMTMVSNVLNAVPNPTTLLSGILGGLSTGLTGGATTPAPTTGAFPDPTQLLNALLPGGLNPFQLLNGILGGAPTAP